jgi:hypothetical protein
VVQRIYILVIRDVNKPASPPFHWPSAYRVLIDDNFHFMDETERVTHGQFETADGALEACRAIVDEFLADAFKPGMTAAALYERYVSFGDDPFIRPVDPKDATAVSFSAWDYARERCEVLGRGHLIFGKTDPSTGP